MKYKIIFLFLFQNCLSMDNPYGDGHHNHWGAERYQQESPDQSSTSSQDQDVLCNAASEVFEKYRNSDVPCIREQLRKVIEEEVRSPLMDQSVMASSIHRIRSGDIGNSDTASSNYLHDLIIRATTLTLQEQAKDINHKQSSINSRFTKKQLVAICGAVSTLIASVSAIITSYSKSC